MLIVKRKRGEVIVIDGDVRIKVLEANRGYVRLAIDAPKYVKVLPIEKPEVKVREFQK